MRSAFGFVGILPGVRMNLGKRGISTAIGVRGAHVTLRAGHTPRTTVGLPVSWLGYTEGSGCQTKESLQERSRRREMPRALPNGRAWGGLRRAATIVAIAAVAVLSVVSR